MTRFARWSLALLLFAPALARAGECEDAYSECQEDCLIQFGGSVRVEMKKKYGKCLKKCTKTANTCSERKMEIEKGNLDEGALDDRKKDEKKPLPAAVPGAPVEEPKQAEKKSSPQPKPAAPVGADAPEPLRVTPEKEPVTTPGDELREDRPAESTKKKRKEKESAPKPAEDPDDLRNY